MEQHWAESQMDQWRQAMERPIQFVKLRPEAVTPKLAKPGDVGFDLVCLDGGFVPPHSYVSFHSGIAIKLPAGLWAMITGRSSTWRNRGLISMQGIIDTEYTGELLSGVFNPGDEPVFVEPDARLKQVLIFPALTPPWVEVDKLPETVRGTSGFGSSDA
jgi:dUTP pyrophosphatase